MQVWCGRLSPTARTVLAKIIWLTSVGRNAIVVIITALIAFGCDPELPDVEGSIKNTTFILTGNLDGGLEGIFQVPPFSVKNETTGETITEFGEMLSNLGAAIIILPLMAVLENIAIAKAFGKYVRQKRYEEEKSHCLIKCFSNNFIILIVSERQTNRCQPRNDCTWCMQFSRLLCAIIPHNWIIFKNCSERGKWSKNTRRWDLYRWTCFACPGFFDAFMRIYT